METEKEKTKMNAAQSRRTGHLQWMKFLIRRTTRPPQIAEEPFSLDFPKDGE
jgi:hypothetical protein